MDMQGLAGAMWVERRMLTRTTIIANELRRSTRRRTEGAIDFKARIAALRARNASRWQIREAGWEAGEQESPHSLADVLFALQEAGLGRAAVVEESNQHLVVRVSDCLACQSGHGGEGCEFTAGFLAGCMMATRRYAAVDVDEVGSEAEHCTIRTVLRMK
jgi:predicted hydrocarbon binding protein